MANLRAEFAGRGELSERQQTLNAHLRELKKFAQAFKVAVVVTNQVMAVPDQFSLGGPQVKSCGGPVMVDARARTSFVGAPRPPRPLAGPQHEHEDLPQEGGPRPAQGRPPALALHALRRLPLLDRGRRRRRRGRRLSADRHKLPARPRPPTRPLHTSPLRAPRPRRSRSRPRPRAAVSKAAASRKLQGDIHIIRRDDPAPLWRARSPWRPRAHTSAWLPWCPAQHKGQTGSTHQRLFAP